MKYNQKKDKKTGCKDDKKKNNWLAFIFANNVINGRGRGLFSIPKLYR